MDLLAYALNLDNARGSVVLERLRWLQKRRTSVTAALTLSVVECAQTLKSKRAAATKFDIDEKCAWILAASLKHPSASWEEESIEVGGHQLGQTCEEKLAVWAGQPQEVRNPVSTGGYDSLFGLWLLKKVYRKTMEVSCGNGTV